MKKLIVLLLIFSFLLPIPVNAIAMETILTTFLWGVGYFSSRPQQTITSVGAYEIYQEIPKEFQAQMGGAERLWVKPQSDSGIHRLIVWFDEKQQQEREKEGKPKPRAYAVASFPTRGVDVKESYFVINNHKSVCEEPSRQITIQLPTDDDTKSYSIEIGINLPGKGNGGSVNFRYRATTLDNFYREYLAEKSFGKIVVDAWQKAEAAKAAEAKPPLTPPIQTAPKISKTVVRIMVLEKKGGLDYTHGNFVISNNGKEIFRGLLSGSKDFEVEEGTVSVQALKGSWMASPGAVIDTRKGEDLIQIFPKGGGRR